MKRDADAGAGPGCGAVGALRADPFPPRAGTPEDFAAFVLHVIENRMVNGGTVRLDGALRMG